jgi:hypothetical protein
LVFCACLAVFVKISQRNDDQELVELIQLFDILWLKDLGCTLLNSIKTFDEFKQGWELNHLEDPCIQLVTFHAKH